MIENPKTDSSELLRCTAASLVACFTIHPDMLFLGAEISNLKGDMLAESWLKIWEELGAARGGAARSDIDGQGS